MSSNSKMRAREQRRIEKRKVKAAKRQAWEAKIAAGRNAKSTGSATRDPNYMRPRTHPNGSCGNIGCKRCNASL